jgi:hypothetical protein
MELFLNIKARHVLLLVVVSALVAGVGNVIGFGGTPETSGHTASEVMPGPFPPGDFQIQGGLTVNDIICNSGNCIGSSEISNDLTCTDIGTPLTSACVQSAAGLSCASCTGNNLNAAGHVYVATNSRIYFGDSQQASIYYNGTALIISG